MDKQTIKLIQKGKNHIKTLTKDSELFKNVGFGLSLVIDFINLHHGKLLISSEENEGSLFTVKFLQGTSHYNAENLAPAYSNHYQIVKEKLGENKDTIEVQEKIVQEELSYLVLIDFDDDFTFFIKKHFDNEYNVESLPYSKSIPEILARKHPAVVLIDIQDKDSEGLKACEIIKSKQEFSNILVIVISSDDDEENEDYCYQSGADLWLKKPIKIHHLETRIKNLLETKQKLSEKIKQKLIVNPKEINIFSNDDIFLANVMKIIEENISNEAFTVDQLASELYISNSGLYRRLNQLTQQSPNRFIRTIRLKRAAQLLLTQNYKVNEVCTMVGFPEQRYFSSCFKKQFNVSPKTYSLKNKDKNI